MNLFDAENVFIQNFTLELYSWAFDLTRTRNFDLNYPLYDHALCPYADIFNHLSSSTNTWYIRDNTTVVFTTDDQTIQRGEQVFISYGGITGNSRLLSDYGFLIPNNEVNSLIFFIPKDEKLRDRKARLNRAESHQLYFMIRPIQLMRFWRILVSENTLENETNPQR